MESYDLKELEAARVEIARMRGHVDRGQFVASLDLLTTSERLLATVGVLREQLAALTEQRRQDGLVYQDNALRARAWETVEQALVNADEGRVGDDSIAFAARLARCVVLRAKRAA